MKSTAVEVPLCGRRRTVAALTDRPVIGLSRDQRAVARYRLE